MKRLLGTKLNNRSEDEATNPMDGVANLADVMLVLVVGFMLALIINWNLDVGAISHLSKPEQSPEVALELDREYMEDLDRENEDIDSKDMAKLGSVYFDEETGKYYIVVD